RYRVTAEICHATGLFDAEVGLYCGHAESAHSEASEHRYVCLSYADLSPLAHKYKGPGGGMGSAVSLRSFRYSSPDPPGGRVDQAAISFAWFDPPRLQNDEAGPWRRISLEVS